MLHSITGKSADGWIKIQCRKTDGDGEKIDGPEVNVSNRDKERVGQKRGVQEDGARKAEYGRD